MSQLHLGIGINIGIASGGAAPIVYNVNTSLAGATISDTGTGVTASGRIRFNNSGTVDFLRTVQGNTPGAQNWATPFGGADTPGAQFWVRFNTVSGTPSTGTANAWLALSTSPQIGRSRPAPAGTNTYVMTVSFATDAAGANVVHTTSEYTLRGTYV